MTLQAVFFDMGGTIETFRYSRESRLRATPGLRQRLLSSGVELPSTDEQLYELVVAGLERYHRWSLVSLEELPPARVWREYVFADQPVDALRLEAAGEDLGRLGRARTDRRQRRPGNVAQVIGEADGDLARAQDPPADSVRHATLRFNPPAAPSPTYYNPP